VNLPISDKKEKKRKSLSQTLIWMSWNSLYYKKLQKCNVTTKNHDMTFIFHEDTLNRQTEEIGFIFPLKKKIQLGKTIVNIELRQIMITHNNA